MSREISLKNAVPIAAGNKRRVYQHPHDDDLLIKIVMPEVVERRWGSGQRWYKTARRHGIYVNAFREIDEFIALRTRSAEAAKLIAPLQGMVETDLGLGLVAEKIRDQAGNLAPSLRAVLAKEGTSPEVLAALKRFAQDAIRHDLIFGKLHGGNLVFGWDADEQRRRFVMVDGYGEKTLIPIHRWSHLANVRNSKLAFRKLGREITRLVIVLDPVLRSGWIPGSTDWFL